MKIKLFSPKQSALSLWKNLPPIPPKEALKMPNYRGNSSSKIVLIAPVPDLQEYGLKIPFTGQIARMFHEILRSEGIPTNKVFVIPCVRWGTKALTGNTADIMEFVRTALKKEFFDFVVSVGEDATRWIVNGGRKANMGTFAGQLVYPPSLYHKPLFVFSDPKGLVPEMTANDRENYFRKRGAETLSKKITKQAEKLAMILAQKRHH